MVAGQQILATKEGKGKLPKQAAPDERYGWCYQA
jgi:hypothetical protein